MSELKLNASPAPTYRWLRMGAKRLPVPAAAVPAPVEEELPEGLVIHGKPTLRGGTVDPRGDHRIAMAAAVAASVCRESVVIPGAECAAKSYPRFWEDLETLKGEKP